jgi:chemotaxis protein MotA
LTLIIGFVTLFASVLVGYTMHGGKIPALIQINEFIIIGGAGFATLVAGSSIQTVMSIFKDIMALLKPNPYGRDAYLQLLQFAYDISNLARREGMLAIESHIERPEESELIERYPAVAKNHHALSFFADSMRLVVMGGVGVYEMQEMMEADVEVFSEESKKNAGLIVKIGDAMPGFGICAAVLGIVITMQAIDGPPEEIGEKVGAALVGTFLGILLAYGVFQPISMALEARAEAGIKYLNCLKCAILTFAQGLPPILVAEFARRTIDTECRPTFLEMEDIVKVRGQANNSKSGSDDMQDAA